MKGHSSAQLPTLLSNAAAADGKGKWKAKGNAGGKSGRKKGNSRFRGDKTDRLQESLIEAIAKATAPVAEPDLSDPDGQKAREKALGALEEKAAKEAAEKLRKKEEREAKTRAYIQRVRDWTDGAVFYPRQASPWWLYRIAEQLSRVRLVYYCAAILFLVLLTAIADLFLRPTSGVVFRWTFRAVLYGVSGVVLLLIFLAGAGAQLIVSFGPKFEGLTERWKIKRSIENPHPEFDVRTAAMRRQDLEYADPICAVVAYTVTNRWGEESKQEFIVSLELLMQIVTGSSADPATAYEDESVTFERLRRLANTFLATNISRDSALSKEGEALTLLVSNTTLMALGVVRAYVRRIPREKPAPIWVRWLSRKPSEKPLAFPRGPTAV